MNIEFKKIDYSKLKNKSIALIVDDSAGTRFGALLNEVLNISVEIYNVGNNEDFCVVNSLIRELNYDEDVLLIIVASDECYEAMVHRKKKFSYDHPKLDVKTKSLAEVLEIESKINNLNASRVIARLNDFIK